MKQHVSILLGEEEGAGTVMAGDVANPIPVIGKTVKRKPLKKKKKSEIEEDAKGIKTSDNDGHSHYVTDLEPEMVTKDGSAFLTTSKDGGHIHTVSLDVPQVEKILNHKEVKTQTSKDDGHTHDVIFISSRTLEELKGEKVETEENTNSNMIEETDKFKYFLEGDKKVFEILDEADFNIFYQGLRKVNPRFWRQSPITVKMMERMNENRGLWFVVRYGDKQYKPFDKTI